MKKITIVFMSVLMIFASCSMNPSYDANENTKTVEEPSNEEPKEDNTKNNTEEPSNEEPKEEDDTENDNVVTEPTENDNNEEGNSENTKTVEEPKEDDTEDEVVEDESSNEEDDTENEVVEDKTCEIDEDTKILGLNYFVCVNNFQKKLSPSINNESEAKKDTFLIRDYVSKYIEIRVRYNNKKLNFSSVNDTYIITDVMKKDSTINITIEWK